MKKYISLLSLLFIILIIVNSESAGNLDNNTYNKTISMSDNNYYNSLFKKLNSSFDFIYSNYSLNKDINLIKTLISL